LIAAQDLSQSKAGAHAQSVNKGNIPYHYPVLNVLVVFLAKALKVKDRI
jgi:hypothetical protein